MAGRRDVCVLGSTGSIGAQTLDVVTAAPARFRVRAVSAGGGQPELLAAQAVAHRVAAVGIADPVAAREVSERIAAAWPDGVPAPRVLAGPRANDDLAAEPVDVVVNAVAGAQGLRATLAALDAGNVVALANKESLIAGGSLVLDRAKPGQLVPLDSEHSALAQCLRAGAAAEVRRLVVTASGGPFRGRRREELTDVTPAQALAHPTWDMGRLITTNSATLVNKGLEVIEANLLFGVPYDRIEVVVHPQSAIHSMVEFVDGSTIAQVSPPDMRLPISLALGWPERVPGAARPVDWTQAQHWSFEPLDDDAFPAVALARRAGEARGLAPAVYNAANEVLVDAFHDGAVGFLAIVDTVAAVLGEWLSERHEDQRSPGTVEDVERADGWARERAMTLAAGG